jgi:integrase
MNTIKRAELQRFHLKLREDGLSAATCDHYAKLLRRVLNLAVDWEVLEANPLARIKLFREDNRIERYMNDEELRRFLTVLNTHQNRPVCDIALFLLSTGARLGEALTAKWELVDLDTRVWRVPASISKSKKMRSIPLNDSAIDVLLSLGTQEYEYLFINVNTGKPYSCIKKSWNRIRIEAGLPKLRLHDLRHQYASMLVNEGRSLYEVQQILGHSDPKVTQRYAHLNSDSLREAANAASGRISSAQNSTAAPRSGLRLVTSGENVV